MSNKGFSAKAVRDGAMMTALSVIFMLAGTYIPPVSLLGMLLSGVPLAVLYIKDGLKPAVYAALVASLIYFVFTGNFLGAVLTMLAYGVPGLVSGICLKKKLSVYYAVFSVGAAFLFGFLCELVSVKLFMGGIEDMFNQVFEMTEKNLKPMLASIAEKSGDADLAKATEQIMESVKYTFKLYFPAMAITISVVSGYLIYCFSGYILKKIRVFKGNIPPFNMLKAPKNFCNASALILLVSLFVKNQMLSVVFLNVVFILYFLIGIAGFSFVDYKISRHIPKGFVRVVLYAAIFLFGAGLMSFAAMIFVLIGFADSSMNFRNICEEGEDLQSREL